MKSRCMLQYGSQITLVVTVKILFIAPNRLGDAILASGLIEQCRRRYPGAQFTIACGPVAAPLFQALPGLVEILVLRKSSGWRRWRHWADLLACRLGSILGFGCRYARVGQCLGAADPAAAHLAWQASPINTVLWPCQGFLTLPMPPRRPRMFGFQRHIIRKRQRSLVMTLGQSWRSHQRRIGSVKYGRLSVLWRSQKR
jgi:hypothetical protein